MLKRITIIVDQYLNVAVIVVRAGKTNDFFDCKNTHLLLIIDRISLRF